MILCSVLKPFERREGKRQAPGPHCCPDVTNSCIYGGIIQSGSFSRTVPIKRWHFPRAGSPLMFYVLLLSRICVLLSKKANFSQRAEDGESAFCLWRTHCCSGDLTEAKSRSFFFKGKCHPHATNSSCLSHYRPRTRLLHTSGQLPFIPSVGGKYSGWAPLGGEETQMLRE